MVSAIPVGPMLTVNGCPPVGGGPSPMSRTAVPLRVAVPPAIVELVIQATMVTCWDRPRRLIPVNWTSTSPFDTPLAFCAPIPKIPPASSTPLSLADAGKMPAAAAVVVDAAYRLAPANESRRPPGVDAKRGHRVGIERRGQHGAAAGDLRDGVATQVGEGARRAQGRDARLGEARRQGDAHQHGEDRR